MTRTRVLAVQLVGLGEVAHRLLELAHAAVDLRAPRVGLQVALVQVDGA